MKQLAKLSHALKRDKKFRAQVFILSTLVIVVYTVSIIAAVTELSIDKTKIDQVDVPHVVNEYLSEMNYQLELQLINYINNAGVTTNTIISNIQSFISSFSLYASSKGVDTSINLRLNEFSLNAVKAGTAPLPLTANYNHTLYISLNSSILFQSSSSGSTVSGVFIHYFGINFASNQGFTAISIAEKDFFGNTLQFISGATFTTPTGVSDQGNGSYSGSFAGGISCTLPNGIHFIS